MRSVHKFLLPLLSLSLLLAAGTAQAGELDAFVGKSGKIDIAGGTAHIPVMKEAAKRIMQKNPAIRITVAGGGSGVGVQKVGEGLVDIGNTGRALTEAEVAKYGLKSYAFAIDGVAAVVHPKNQVANLSHSQVQDIFAGKITNWKAVGGHDAAIHLYTRDEASGTREVFWEIMLKKGKIADGANVVASNGAMKTALAGDPDGIGYVSIGHIDHSIKAPTLDGVAPTQEHAKSGKYPVIRKLYMNTKGAPQGLVASFISFIQSPEGAAITAADGFIPTR
jgi:phosphate transport system substrate-binding protein